MPMIEPVWVMSEAPARAIPKSVTFARALVVDDHVVRLEVAVDDPRRCAKRAALQDLHRRCRSRASGSSGASCAISSFSERPSRYSIAM